MGCYIDTFQSNQKILNFSDPKYKYAIMRGDDAIVELEIWMLVETEEEAKETVASETEAYDDPKNYPFSYEEIIRNPFTSFTGRTSIMVYTTKCS